MHMCFGKGICESIAQRQQQRVSEPLELEWVLGTNFFFFCLGTKVKSSGMLRQAHCTALNSILRPGPLQEQCVHLPNEPFPGPTSPEALHSYRIFLWEIPKGPLPCFQAWRLGRLYMKLFQGVKQDGLEWENPGFNQALEKGKNSG